MTVIFYISAIVAIMATLRVITCAHAVHALLYFIVSLFSVAVIFFTLGAPFVAALEVIIYAGAIMVLFLFVVMLLGHELEDARRQRVGFRPGDWIGPVLLAAILAGELFYVFWSSGPPRAAASVIGPRAVGLSLFGPYLLGVEIASFLLLAGLVGAYHLGRRDEDAEAQSP